MPLQVARFGPFVKGVVEGMNSDLDVTGALRFARNSYMDGVGRLLARPGTALAFTLKDDGGGPANVTSVIAIVPFGDGALAVAHSTVTSKFYLYRFNSDMTGWFNAGGVLQNNTNASPVGVLWAVAPNPDKVIIAEGLGEAFIAHNVAGATFRSKRYSVAGGILNVDANLRGAGVEQTFFRGFVSFQQHLWGWGYGSEAAGENDRPELLRFGIPIFGTSGGGYFLQADSITVGHRVRSVLERVVAAVVAGQVLYVGTPYSLWPITGFGRNSWDKNRPLDDSYGFASVLGQVSANGVLHYWSARGPLRVAGLTVPEPLWDGIGVAVGGVFDAASIVAVFDPDRDQVMWMYRNQTTGRVSAIAAFDTRREILVGPDGDIGLGIRCAGLVQPTGITGPNAPPTTPSTTAIGYSVATGNLVAGDNSAGTRTVWEVKRQADTIWTVAAETDATQLAYQFTGLTGATAYEWRAKHRKNGQDSVYLGPVAGTQFNTASALNPPSACDISYIPTPHYLKTAWVNSGEADVSTEVWHDKNGGGYTLVGTVSPGAASHFRYIGSEVGVFSAKVRHIKSGFPASNYSNVDAVSV